jgi:DNA-binding XRE family transcriptional regulator
MSLYLVVVQNVNQGTVAKQIGIYKTTTKRIELDRIKEDL